MLAAVVAVVGGWFVLLFNTASSSPRLSLTSTEQVEDAPAPVYADVTRVIMAFATPTIATPTIAPTATSTPTREWVGYPWPTVAPTEHPCPGALSCELDIPWTPVFGFSPPKGTG